MLSSPAAKAHIANWVAETVDPAWCVSWEDDSLIVRHRLPGAVGERRILGSPEVTCDGKSILGDAEPGEAEPTDELAYVMAKVAKALNWPTVTVRGSSQFQARFRWYALHESDFFSWTVETARILAEQRPAGFDWESVAEELEDLGISEQRALESQLRVVLTHLLKWAHQPGHQSRSWRLSIGNARDEVRELLERDPGLQQKISALYSSAYRKARRDAAIDSGLELEVFAPSPPWSYEQVTDDDFWPGAPADN